MSLANGIKQTSNLAKNAALRVSDSIIDPFQTQIAYAGGIPLNNRNNQVSVTINAGLGTDPYELGRAVRAALDKYDGVNGR